MSIDLELTYKHNLEAIKDIGSSLYDDIIDTNIDDIELFNIEDNINLKVNNNILYPDNSALAIKKQVSTFLNAPSAYFKKPTRSINEGEGYIHDRFIEELEKSSPYLKEKNHFKDYHHNMDNFFPIMIMYGIGSGKHIEQIMQQSNIKKLLIVDENYALLKTSFHIIDWRPIIKHFQQEGHELLFIIGKEPKKLAHSMLNDIIKYNSYNLYYLPYYTHYNSDFFTELKNEVTYKINLGFQGHGFYDDELMSLNHTIANIKCKNPVFTNTKSLPEDSSVFIIGSGPSIDNDIEHIKKLKGKAVIFSCGTALKILHANNIIPDYHFESERTYVVQTMLTDSLPKDYLKKINFIGLNVIYPDVFKLFKTTKIFFRENDCGGSIAPNNIPHLHHCNPTAVNATLSFASEIGFKNIFLFGADMGYENEDYHHSKYSVYNDKCSTYFDFKDAIPNQTLYSGNFDQTAKFLSNDILIWCKQRAENCIFDYKNIRKKPINYFNCSNGLFISKATPVHANKIHLNETLDKESVLNGIKESFDCDFEQLHKILKENFTNEKDKFYSTLETIEDFINKKHIETYPELFMFFDKAYVLVSDFSEDTLHPRSSLTRSLLRGTFYHFFITILSHSLGVIDKKNSFLYINHGLQLLLQFINEVKDSMRSVKFD